MAQVYMLTFPNGKSYIGATSGTAENRFKFHRRPSSNPTSYVAKAIKEFGPESVKIDVLFETLVSNEKWSFAPFDAERALIIEFNTYYPNGYNHTRQFTEEAMNKMRLARKRRVEN